jgi:outer membrane biosynthesis protein TonB
MLVALSLAAFNSASTPLPLDEDKPVELTMVDLSATPPPPSAKANPAYIETDPSKETPDEPAEKTFESNANSKAASNQPASGDAPVPSQAGKDRPFLQMETQQSSVAMQGSAAQPPPQPTPAPTAAATPPPVQTPPPVETPKPRPSEAPKPTPLPEPAATPDLSKFAMLTSTPPPAFRNPEEAESPPPEVGPTAPPVISRPLPERPATAYQPEKQQTRMTGRITDRGPASVNAVGTPLGKYQKQVSDAIGSRWYYYMKTNGELASIGTAQLEAEVASSGKVENLRIVANDANEAFANICLQSFQQANIPPIPPDVAATLPAGKLHVTFSFTHYANQ